jgi:hypothetical protein
MELRQALADVAAIRDQLARSEHFHGYRSLTIAFSGVAGIAAALAQSVWLTDPVEQLPTYLALWVGAAAVNEICLRARAAQSSLARRTALFALEQFLPAAAAGALVTIVIVRGAADAAWMLPGLWAVLFSLGVFASCRLLPRPLLLVGVWYLAAGLAALAWGQGAAALAPWTMGAAFGVGQLLTALLLHVTLERRPQAEA